MKEYVCTAEIEGTTYEFETCGATLVMDAFNQFTAYLNTYSPGWPHKVLETFSVTRQVVTH